MKWNYVFKLVFTLLLCSCSRIQEVGESDEIQDVSLSEVARILSDLPLGPEHLAEVHDAVCSSSGNGYDEEYLMSSLFNAPGCGVGSSTTKAGSYPHPLRDLFRDYLLAGGTKAGSTHADVEAYINRLINSSAQLYWPFSEDWDGKTYPIVTFDPGYGAESNYGYEIKVGKDGVRVIDSVYVDESVAEQRPVWVINTNDDSAFTPLEMYTRTKSETSGESLYMKTFKAKRNYDSWFGGASEYFVKIGAVDGFKASSDEDLRLYTPTVTDFMISVRRRDVGKELPFEVLLLSEVTDQMDKVAFLITEDDGGETKNWKCEAQVKFKSKTYGFDIDIPYKDKDDIVWRGQLSMSMFPSRKNVVGHFGDVEIGFRKE